MAIHESVRSRMESLVQQVQNAVCTAIENLDGNGFQEDHWTRKEGGFGISRVLERGNVFEKVGINMSTVTGALSREAAQVARIEHDEPDEDAAPFFVTSVSMIIHPHNPMVPSAHAHYRYFEVGNGDTPSSWWFGGGADLTPYYLFEEDVVHFHRQHKEACDPYGTDFYPRFKQACDEYFYLSHRREYRGVGGILLGNLNGHDREMLADLTTSCAQAFLPAYLPIVERRKDLPFTDQQQRWQRIRRGRYVEFNLVCDRGTAFGLKTGGRIESILLSLPLLASWEYNDQPAPQSEEARLMEVLRHPRSWV